MASKAKSAPAKRRITARPTLDREVVKSASRTMQILEYLDDIRRDASVMEVVRALGLPQSSASALLRSLATLGYLDYDREKRTYMTSARVAMLGSWLGTEFFCEGPILHLMSELNEATGETIVLGTPVGLYVHYIHVLQAKDPSRPHMALGTARPLVHSGAGYALLSAMDDALVMRLALRYNAAFAPVDRRIDIADLFTHVNACRRDGYAFTHGIQVAGGGIIAALLPPRPHQRRFVVGVAGATDVLKAREGEYAQLLRAGVERYAETLVAAHARALPAPLFATG